MSGIIFRLTLVMLACASAPVAVIWLLNVSIPLSSAVNACLAVSSILFFTFLGAIAIRSVLRPIIRALGEWEQVLEENGSWPSSWSSQVLRRVPELHRLFQTLSRLAESQQLTTKRLSDIVARRTERLEHSEKRTQVSMDHLRAVLDGSPEPIAVINPDGRLVLFNPALRELVGSSEDISLQLHHVRAFLSEMFGHHSDAVKAWDGECYDESGGLAAQWEVPELGGFSLHAFSAPISSTEDGRREGRLWIFRDDTDSRRLAEELQHANRLDAVGRLAGGIAHDFNNLLTALGGHLQLLRHSLGDSLGPVDRHTLNTAEGAATRGAELVSQLLRFSRNEKIESTPIMVSPVLKEVKDLLSHTIDRRIELRTEISDQNISVLGDAGQLEQVLLNLAVNARDAIDGAGEIVLSCEFADDKRRTGGDVGWVRIRVSDNGSGMTAEVRDRVFEPFFTTKGQGEGTGLGLATTYGIVHRHGGWLECESSPGEGTTFTIYLLRAEMSSSPDGGVDSKIEEASLLLKAGAQSVEGRQQTVLVVDDEAAVRAVAEGSLRLAGFDVVTAVDGGAALRYLDTGPGKDIDLVLLDMTMPELSGTETFERLRSAGKDVPVVFCSGQPIDPIAVEKAVGWAPEGVIQKPYAIALLAETVQQVLCTASA